MPNSLVFYMGSVKKWHIWITLSATIQLRQMLCFQVEIRLYD